MLIVIAAYLIGAILVVARLTKLYDRGDLHKLLRAFDKEFVELPLDSQNSYIGVAIFIVAIIWPIAVPISLIWGICDMLRK